jgi:hypothetical protein
MMLLRVRQQQSIAYFCRLLVTLYFKMSHHSSPYFHCLCLITSRRCAATLQLGTPRCIFNFSAFLTSNFKINFSCTEFGVLGTFFQGVRLTGGGIKLCNGEHYNSNILPSIKFFIGIILENRNYLVT